MDPDPHLNYLQLIILLAVFYFYTRQFLRFALQASIVNSRANWFDFQFNEMLSKGLYYSQDLSNRQQQQYAISSVHVTSSSQVSGFKGPTNNGKGFFAWFITWAKRWLGEDSTNLLNMERLGMTEPGLPPSHYQQVKLRLLIKKAFRWYITAQAFMTLSLFTWLLFNNTSLTFISTIYAFLLVVWAGINFTLMLWGKKGGYILEYFRLTAIVIFAAYLLQDSYWFREGLFTVSGIAFFFLFWLLTLNRVFKR